jgi:hypothetical protein
MSPAESEFPETIEAHRNYQISGHRHPARLRELVTRPRSFDYRRLFLISCIKGVLIDYKTLRRPYTEERLQVHRRGDAYG